MAKKKLNKVQRREQRLRKARQWIVTYKGTPKKLVKHYTVTLLNLGMLITEKPDKSRFSWKFVAYLIRYAAIYAYFLENIDFTAFLSL